MEELRAAAPSLSSFISIFHAELTQLTQTQLNSTPTLSTSIYYDNLIHLN